MSLDPISAALDLGGKVIDKLFPDPAQRDAAKLELLKLQQSGELAEMTAQTDTNKIEAASASIFVSGARPFILWVCGIAMAYVSIIEPIARFAANVGFGYTGSFPVIDTTITMQVLLGLLGLSGFRSYDKKNGVAS